MSAILIVEGHDEAALVNKLCEFYELVPIKTINAGGSGNIDKEFQSALKAAIVGSSVTNIAILCDAEEDPQKCKDQLEEYRKQIANSISPKIHYEYLILPSDSSQGSLETMCLELIAADDSLLDCTNQFVACLDATAPQTHKLTTQARKDKARFLIRHYAATGAPQGFKSLLNDQQIKLESSIFKPILAMLERLTVKKQP